MPTYTYRCRGCGDFDLTASIASRPESAPCPSCGAGTYRMVGAPHLATVSRSLHAVADRAGRSAESPEVVRSIPPAAQVSRPAPRAGRYPPLPRS